ncbi:hypothetical protein M8C21_022659 [Ambrosia artemisiifolia]|uniref:Uncharacterized protein n=1 Tax=Ambrosia artemisiifolia TaxID=4212 RepID=A0AAD5CTZ2_AMBAR|nr:hypothetical protein M8C21_022659 [Ambrosia artemisiifolia]
MGSYRRDVTMKEKEDELGLFMEMRICDERDQQLLLQDTQQDAFDSSLGSVEGSSHMFSMPSAAPARKTGADEFLNSESDKNDYEWLLTPPGTPLFPSLELESQKTVMAQTGTPKARPTALRSRLSSTNPEATGRNNLVSRQQVPSPGLNTSSTGLRRPSSSGGPASRPATPTGRPATSTGRPTLGSSTRSISNSTKTVSNTSRPTSTATSRLTSTATSRLTSTATSKLTSTTTSRPTSTTSRPTSIATSRPTSTTTSRPTRSSTPTSRSTMGSTKPTLPARSSTPTPRSTARSSTPTSRPTLPVTRPTSRAATPTRRQPTLTTSTKTSTPTAKSPAVTKPVPNTTRSGGAPPPPRSSSPSVRPKPWKPHEMPGYSLDAPPNLRTSVSDRPPSVTRGRPGAPNSRSSSVEPVANGRIRRQSCSPSRGRLPNGMVHSSGSSVPVPALNRAYAKANDNVSPGLYGTKMVERVINMRKLVPPKQDNKRSPHSNLSAKSSPDSGGFGRSLSKKSLDMAMRHMDIRRTIPGNLRPLMNNIPASSMYSVRTGPTRTRTISVSDSPLATSSNASSEMSVNNNNSLCLDGNIDDEINSERRVLNIRGR